MQEWKTLSFGGFWAKEKVIRGSCCENRSIIYRYPGRVEKGNGRRVNLSVFYWNASVWVLEHLPERSAHKAEENQRDEDGSWR